MERKNIGFISRKSNECIANQNWLYSYHLSWKDKFTRQNKVYALHALNDGNDLVNQSAQQGQPV